MCDVATVSRLVMRLFKGWRGYAAFAQVLDEFPHMQAYLAGGGVRNLLLDPEAKCRDFDVFLGGPCVSEFLERLGRTGRSKLGVFGNFKWYPDAEEPTYADCIRISTFDVIWPSENIVDVLRQFDFTGNAIAVDLRSGAVLDPQNGVRDMQRRIMRAIRFDFPDKPIKPGHPLPTPVCVWYRILHYADKLGLRIEPVTMQWLRDHRTAYDAYWDVFTTEFKKTYPKALLQEDRAQELRQAS